MIGLAALSLAATCWAWFPADPSPRAAQRLGFPETRPHRTGRSWVKPAAAVVGTVMVFVIVAPNLLVWVVPAAVVAVTLGWLARHGGAERARRQTADEVVHACQALAAQLRVGDIPARALSSVAADSQLLAPAAAAQAIGGDVPAALSAIAGQPGCGGLAELARSWQLCGLTGAPVAQAATRVAEGLREDAAAERLVAGELAGPRATGRLLALLPLLGIGLGFVGGGDPVSFLLHTEFGRLALAGAVCLVCAGLVWTTRLATLPEPDGAGAR